MNSNNNRNNTPPVNGQRRRPPMTDEQRQAYEERRRAYLESKRRQEDEKRSITRKRLMLAIIFLVTLIILVVIATVIVSVALSSDDPAEIKTYSFRIDGERNSVAAYDAKRNGVLCIDLMSLKPVLGLTDSDTPGNADSVTFTSQKTGSMAIFRNGSAIAAINSQNVLMETTASVTADSCSVPLSFVARCFGGITVEVNNRVVYITTTDEAHEIFAKSNDTLDMIIEFSADLSGYEQYMNPTGENRDAFLLLVNKQYPLGQSFVPANLVTLGGAYCPNENANQLDSTAAKALEAMLKELWTNGYTNITGTSGYRSYARQVSLFSTYKENERTNNPGLTDAQIEALVLAYSAAPGTSEHQSGLCIDLIDNTRGGLENYPDTGYFTSAAIYNWLVNNAWKFGFILRYPEDKTTVTGYSYESWHFRFVGRYHAQKMYISGQTLEEYLETVS